MVDPFIQENFKTMQGNYVEGDPVPLLNHDTYYNNGNNVFCVNLDPDDQLGEYDTRGIEQGELSITLNFANNLPTHSIVIGAYVV